MSIIETQELAAGDIIEINVGYSMILPHFYIIDGFTPSGKSAYIYELESMFDPSDPPYNQRGYKIPTDRKIGERKTCRILRGHVNVDGHYSWKWNGKPSLYDSMD